MTGCTSFGLPLKNGYSIQTSFMVPSCSNHLHILRHNQCLDLPFHAAVWATALTFSRQWLRETTVKNLASFPAIVLLALLWSPFANTPMAHLPLSKSLDKDNE